MRNIFCAAASLIAISSATSALAQTSSTGAAEAGAGEIVVTATRHAEPMSKVPLSVSAFSQEMLDKRGVKDISGLVRQTPGIQLDPSGFGNQTNIAIRGVSSTVGAATTGVYIDDTPIQSRQVGYTSTNAFPAVFDLERVEVLRGPQGTLFGAGSEGGTVRFITPQPSLSATHLYAKAEGSATQDGAPSGEIGASVSTPLIADKLGLSLAGWIRRDGGYVDRQDANTPGAPLLGHVNWGVSKVGRAALKWQATDALSITPSLFFQQHYQNDSDNFWESLSQPSSGKFVSGQSNQTWDKDTFYLPALNINWRSDALQLVSNTSYYIRDQSSQIDYSTVWSSIFAGQQNTPGYFSAAHNTNSQRTFTQEVRLQSDNPDAKLKWVVGGFYAKSVQNFTEAVVDPNFSLLFGGAPLVAVFGEDLIDGTYSLKGNGRGADEQLAGFADVTYAITAKLKLAAGLRVAQTKFTGSSLFDGPLVGAPQVQAPVSVTEHPVTPKFAIDYQATSDLLFYTSASKGYRIGGTNAPVPALPCAGSLAGYGYTGAPPLYASDSLWSYEAGAKGKTAGGRVSFGASIFHVDWSNIQQQVNLNTCGAQFIANLGSAKSNGFDAQATLRVSHALTLDGTVSYTNAQLKSTIYGAAAATNALSIVSAGDHLDSHPWTLSLGANWEKRVANDYTLYARGDYQYKSRGDKTAATDSATAAFDPGAWHLQALAFASLRAGLRWSTFDAALFVDNIADTHPIVSRAQDNIAVGSYHDITTRPRTFGLTVTYRH